VKDMPHVSLLKKLENLEKRVEQRLLREREEHSQKQEIPKRVKVKKVKLRHLKNQPTLKLVHPRRKRKL
jgi:hypothetical protein